MRRRVMRRVQPALAVEPAVASPQDELMSWFILQYPAQREIVELVVQRVLAGAVDGLLSLAEVRQRLRTCSQCDAIHLRGLTRGCRILLLQLLFRAGPGSARHSGHDVARERGRPAMVAAHAQDRH